jgi:hypothetical protein
MKRGLFLTAALVTLAWYTAPADGQAGKPPTVKEVMKKLNYRDAALTPMLGRALKADSPSWDEIQRDSRTLVNWIDLLSKQDPPKGDKAHWQKLAGAYALDARALDAAVGKRDKPAAQAAHARLANPAACNACHNAHRN